MDALLLLSFSAVFYAFVKKGLAFGRTFVSRVAARCLVECRAFCLLRNLLVFVIEAFIVVIMAIGNRWGG